MTNNIKRNINITERLLKENISYAELGRQVNLSRERIKQIFHKHIRMMRHPSRLKEDMLPDHDVFVLEEVREYKDFWIKQLEKFKNEYSYLTVSDDIDNPVKLTDNIYIVRNYKAVKKAIDLFMTGKKFLGYENYEIPVGYPCLISVHYSERGKEYVSLTFTSLNKVKPLIDVLLV